MKTINAVANGRVNLIGEHTDYNDGWVLPTAIPQAVRVKFVTRPDRKVIARTTMAGANEESFELGEEKPLDRWTDYLKGATKLLVQDGYKIQGFEIEVDSTVPTGSGLSSSAALEVAVLKALREAYSLDLSDEKLALMGQRIENEFVGARVGIMDQMACALANFGEALFLDTMTLKYERIPIPLENVDLVVINSGVVHKFSGDSGYNKRRSECESACAALGAKSLREVSLATVESSPKLSNVERKRARHVVTENTRVHEAVAALKSGNLMELGRLFYESHASMRDDYEVSVEEVDTLVELCSKEEGVYGARLTGGGFGGSIVALVEKGAGAGVAKRVAEKYSKLGTYKATVLVP